MFGFFPGGSCPERLLHDGKAIANQGKVSHVATQYGNKMFEGILRCIGKTLVKE